MAQRLPSVDISELGDDFTPVCPHCDGQIEGLVRQEINEGFGKAYVWMCGRCRKVLGVSHRKGFWMG